MQPVTPRQAPRLAAIVTEYRPWSHADVIVTKLLEGYELLWTAVPPQVEVVSLYTDQVPANDISRDLAARHGVAIYPTIREALTRGGPDLAVEGVVLVGEHGDYPLNEKGQKLYPRRRFFEETVAVFRQSRRVAPVFSDKHLSWNWADAKWMYDTARDLAMPFMAGSSLPVAFRRPPLQVPLDTEIAEIVAVGHGRLESFGFHALEMAQCLAERRRGYESGVASVQCLSDDAFWAAWEAGDRWSRDLQEAALGVVAHRDEPPRQFYDRRRKEAGVVAALAEDQAQPPAASAGVEAVFLVEYRDGLRLAVLMLDGYAREFGVAVRTRGVTATAGRRSQMQPPPSATPATMATCFHLMIQERSWHFSHLVHYMVRMFQTGQPPYPVERTLLTTGILEAAITSLHEGGRRVETPHLDVRYQPPRL